jgi:hypothetical protein
MYRKSYLVICCDILAIIQYGMLVLLTMDTTKINSTRRNENK